MSSVRAASAGSLRCFENESRIVPTESGWSDWKGQGRNQMIRFIAVAGFALSLAVSAQAMTPAPLHQLDGMITQVAWLCGPGMTQVNGVCVSRVAKRHAR